jgi:aconitate hydratase 2/2-methylisocitrate dehydratase
VNVVLQKYRNHVIERAAEGLVPKALDAEQTAALVELVKNPPISEGDFLIDLLTNRVPAGVDEAAYIKAGFLAAVTKGETTSSILTPEKATQLLGTMLGGYNIQPMIC